MSVQSRPITTAPAHGLPSGISFAALIIGLVLWPIGARYSIDGLLWLCNQLLAFLRVGTQIPTPPVWQVYVVLAPIPVICSRVEWGLSLRRVPGAHSGITWLFVVGYDLATTYFGIKYPEPGAWDITRQLAQSLALSGILTAVLTFGPEWLMRGGWRAFKR